MGFYCWSPFTSDVGLSASEPHASTVSSASLNADAHSRRVTPQVCVCLRLCVLHHPVNAQCRHTAWLKGSVMCCQSIFTSYMQPHHCTMSATVGVVGSELRIPDDNRVAIIPFFHSVLHETRLIRHYFPSYSELAEVLNTSWKHHSQDIY